jgi:hypothetical protein
MPGGNGAEAALDLLQSLPLFISCSGIAEIIPHIRFLCVVLPAAVPIVKFHV